MEQLVIVSLDSQYQIYLMQPLYVQIQYNNSLTGGGSNLDCIMSDKKHGL